MIREGPGLHPDGVRFRPSPAQKGAACEPGYFARRPRGCQDLIANFQLLDRHVPSRRADRDAPDTKQGIGDEVTDAAIDVSPKSLGPIKTVAVVGA